MKSRSWFLLSLLLLLAAALCWRLGEQRRLRETPGSTTNAPARLTAWERFLRLPSVLTGQPPVRDVVASAARPPELLSLSNDPRLPFRLRNTQKQEAELFRSETAVLLRNALVETLEPVNLNIPAHLRAQGDPGSYLVQARGAIDSRFREVLRGAGVEIVSYVPNNTYLVRASAALAQQLRVSPRVQSVLPFEPYYKLDMQLLPLAARRAPMPAGRWLNVVLFSGTQEKAKADLRALGAVVKGEQPFPFGHVVTIAPPADSLVALAQMPAVQNIEGWHAPVLMNDLSRVRLDVSTNAVDPVVVAGANWLNLTGLGVFLGHVDSGLDLAHPQLAGRFFTNSASPTSDFDGHGTLVGGAIVGLDFTGLAPTNGSPTNAYYRGIAPGARLYPLSLYSTDYTNYGNVWLITNAALATNIFIVNNSWGYPVSTYDINSALHDEHARDALPFRTNDQPVTHVFAAGNSGGANSGGLGGAADTISSPGNAKNVITVGATEQFRLVPNSTVSTNTGTNDPIATAHSDSDSQVADFSSRGNVGVGVEGPAGRFKPDFVAPGQYVASLRASTFTNVQESDALLGNSQWRYDSGSSIAAGKVSGLLALMQEFFSVNYGRTNGLKPAFNKALLINRAQSLSPAYDFAVSSPITHQGWGIPSLSNTLPGLTAISFLTNNTGVANRIVVVDESALVTNHLASGQFHAYDITLPNAPAVFTATNSLRITLTWTDPPGNPLSSKKLVNDLDLYVTNNAASSNSMQWEGNNFAPGTIFTQNTPAGSESQRDSVNNVENIFITGLSTNALTNTYRVYVIGRRVNVNAVTANTNNVVQDYTLVISTDAATNVTVNLAAPAAAFSTYTNRLASTVTNGVPYLNERVGANPALWTLNGAANANTNGLTNQWNFYIFTNQNYASASVTNFTTNILGATTNVFTNVVQLPMTNGGSNVVLTTFLPPSLARQRHSKEADLDMYVTRTRAGFAPTAPAGAPGLTNLDEQVFSDPRTLRSTNRGGYELITVNNSQLGEVFYVGIKSEDQQGGTYGFFAAATDIPFTSTNTNGNTIVAMFPVPAAIPDGTPDTPGGVTLYGICPTNVVLRSVAVSNTITHENLGDLVGTLVHNGMVITLNNHAISPTGATNPAGGLVTHNLIYDDFRFPPDGPGDVTDLLGQEGVGLWILEVYDNTPFQTGQVDYSSIYLVPFTNAYNTNNNVFYRTIDLAAGQSFVDFLDVPTYATNLDLDIVGGLSVVPGPASSNGVDLLANAPGLGVPTSTTNSNRTLDLDNLDVTNFPHLRISPVASASTAPLSPGRWNFRILNNSAFQLQLTLRYTLGLNLAVADSQISFTNVYAPLLDNYTTNLYLNIADDRVIAGLDVGIAIQHPRISDLVFHLVSPSGTKVLLFEDRAGTNGITSSNFFGNFTENTNYTTSVDTNGNAIQGFLHLDYLLPVKFVPTPYSAVISPPRLMTNMTNLIFGHGTLPSASSPRESPTALAHRGGQLVMAGRVNRTDTADRNGTNDAFLVAYPTPIVTNRYTFFTNITPTTTNLVSFPITNWVVTNYWSGSFSGYRGGNPSLAAASRTPDQTFFNGVAANADGVFAVGETRNYLPPAQFTWIGDSNRSVYDVDLGATVGSVTLTHKGGTNDVRDRVQLEYEGRLLMDFTPAVTLNRATNYVTNVAFSGNSRFLRVIVNPTPTLGTNGWTNYLSVYRGNALEYAVTNFLPAAPTDFILSPQPALPTPPYTVPVPAELNAPNAVALDNSNNVFVADTGNNRILKFRQALTIPDPFAPTPLPVTPVSTDTNGSYLPLTLGAAAHPSGLYNTLSSPRGVVVHTNGDIYVADTGNNLIKHYRGDGTWIRSFGDTASAPNNVAAGSFNAPEGIAICTTTNTTNNVVLFVADTGNGTIRQVDTNGAVTTIAIPLTMLTPALSGPRALVLHQSTDFVATNYVNGSNYMTQAIFGTAANGVNILSGTNLYIADTLNHRIVWLFRTNNAWGAVVLAGSGSSGFVDDTNSMARFDTPSGISRDGAGNLYVSDAGTHLIRRVTPFGVVKTIAGNLAAPAAGNVNADVGAAGRFTLPRGLAADHFGGLFVADSGNHSVRTVMPYQSRTTTNAFAVYFPFSGPTNHTMGVPPVLVSRGLTNSVFNMEMFGNADSRDRFVGVATSQEFGTNGNSTNFLYAVGDAQFSSDASYSGYARMFLSKFTTDGRPVWTRGYLPPAVLGRTYDANTNITGFPVVFGGAAYATAPQAILQTTPAGSATVTTTPMTLTVAGGAVSGFTTPATPVAGPFGSASVFIAAPVSSNMPATSVAVAYGTNVIAAGYSNVSTVASTYRDVPFLMSLETTNGAQLWATNSTNSGKYNSIAVYGTNLIAVGEANPGGLSSLNRSNLIERWSLTGTQLASLTTNFGVGRTSWLSQVIAIEALDRAYAVGSVLNSDKTVDAVMLEIDLQNLAVLSVVTNNITNYNNTPPGIGQSTNYGTAITTDGVDLYVAVEGPGEGNYQDRQAAVFRYRAKNFYLPEESLNAFVGERTWGTRRFYTNILGTPTNYNVTDTAWRLQIADTRAGGTNGTAQVVAWNLNFSYAASNTTALALAAGVNNNPVTLSATPKIFQINVPSAAGVASNLVTATGPVKVTFNPAGAPTPGAAGNLPMFSGAATGSFIVSTNPAVAARLRPGSDYYVAVESLNPRVPIEVTMRVDFDRTEAPPPVTSLASGTPANGFLPRTDAFSQFQIVVPGGAAGASFELFNLTGDVNLYLRRSNGPGALPGPAAFDYRSANPGSVAEQIFLATNGASTSLVPGTWYLGVQNADNAPVNFTVRATTTTTTPYNVVSATDAQPLSGVTTPGNAPNTLFKLTVPSAQKGLLFEVRNLTGAGDLLVRRNAFPTTATFDAANAQAGALPELVVVRTNGALPSLTGDWYFGVVNPGATHVSYVVMARQPTNGVLLSGSPIQIARPPGTGLLTGGNGFGFDLDAVPGEKYQVQYATNAASTNWQVLTNIVAPAGGLIHFIHSGALSNRNFYYRIQVVP